MSMTIDEKVVEMRFDNRQFEQNVHTSLNTIGDLKKSLNFDDAIKGISNVASGVKNFSMDSMATAVMVVHDKFSALEIMAKRVLENITDRAFAAGERLVKSLSTDQIMAGWNKYEQKTSSVQTIMAATSKDWVGKEGQMEFVNEQLDKLNWYTDETSAGFMDMVNNIGKFTSAGVKLEDAVTAMQGIANWGYISGAGLAEQSRAMYNLSQALGTGTVKLMDWKSIENANMATVEFKEMAIQAGVLNGTLKEVSKGVYKTLKGTEVSAQNFNGSLADAWFTSDVLMDTLKGYGDYTNALYEASEFTGMTATQLRRASEEYANGTLNLAEISEETGQPIDDLAEMFETLNSETFDLGRRAFAAAQEAKTLTEAIDATKDAVSTGWMNTAEIIFGDYEEAKKLWTSVSEELLDVFASGAEARNEMLKDWAEMGGREKMLEAIADIWHTIRNVMGAVKEAFRDIFPPMTAKRLTELTEKFYGFAQELRQVTNKWNSLPFAKDKHGQAVQVLNVRMEKFRSIIRGIASALDIVKQAVFAVVKGVASLFKTAASGSGSILDVAAGIGDWLTNLNKLIKENDIFTKAIGKVVDKLRPFAKFISDFIGIVTNALKKIPENLKIFTSGFGNFAGIVQTIFMTINDIIFNTLLKIPILRDHAFEIWSVLNNVGNKIVDFIRNLIPRIKDIFEYFSSLLAWLKWDIREIFNPHGAESFVSSLIHGVINIALDLLLFGMRSILRLFGKSADDTEDLAYGFYEKLWEIFNKIGNVVAAVFDFIIPRLPKILAAIKFTVGLIIEIVSNLLNLLSKLPGKISEIFQNLTGMKIGEAFDKLKNAASGLLEKLKEVFKGFREVDTDAAGELSDKTTKKLSPLTTLFEGFKKVFGGIWAFLKKLAPLFGAVAKAIGTGLSKLGTWIHDAVSNLNGKDVMDFLKDGAIFAILLKIRGLFKNLEKGTGGLGKIFGKKGLLVQTFKDIGGVLKGVTSVLGGVKDTLVAYQNQLKSKSILNIAIAVGLLSLSLILLASLDQEALTRGTVAISTLFANLVVAMKQFGKSSASAKLSGVILAMSIAVLVLSMAVKKLAKIDPESLTRGMLAVGALLEMLVLVAKQLSKEDKMMKGAIGLVAMALAIKMLVKPIKKLGEMDPKVLGQGLLSIAAIMAVMALFVKLTTANKDQSQKMMSVGVGLILLALAMKLIIGSVAKLGKMDPGELLQGVGAISILLLELGAFVGLMNKFAGGAKTAAIAASVVILATALLLIVGAVALMGHMDAKKLKNGLVGIFVILASVSLALVALNKFTNAAALPVIAASLVIVAGAMVILAGAIAMMGHMDPGHLAGGLIAMLLMIGGITVALIALSKLTGTAKLPIIAASLAIVAAALVVLAVALRILGRMSIGKVLTALAAIAGILVILGVATTALGPIAPALLAISGAVALLGAGIMALGIGLTLVAAAGVGAVAILGKLLDVLISSVIGAIPKLVEAATRALSAILKGAADMLPDFIALVKALIAGIIDLIDPNKPDAVVPKLVTAVINLLDYLLKEIAAHTGSIVESLMKIVVDLIEGIRGDKNLERICDGLIGMILDVLDSLIKNIGPLVDKLVKVFVELMKGLGRNVGDIVGSVIDFLIEVLDALGKNLQEKGGKLATAIWSVVEGLIKMVFEFIKKAIATFLDPRSADSIWTILDLLLECVVASVELGIPKLIKAGERIAYAIGQGLGDGMNIVDQFFTGWMDKIAGVERKEGDTYSFGGFLKYMFNGQELDDIEHMSGNTAGLAKAMQNQAFIDAVDSRLTRLIGDSSATTSAYLANQSAMAINAAAYQKHEQQMNESSSAFRKWLEANGGGGNYQYTQYVYLDTKKVGESVTDSVSGNIAKATQQQQRFSMAEAAKGARYAP